MRFQFCSLLLALACLSADAQAPDSSGRWQATLVGVFTLPRLSLSQFGNPACTDAALARARVNGLKFTDLPSIGSGLAKVGEDEFFGITDRGPNGTVGKGGNKQHTFPLPEFCPTIVRLKLAGGEIRISEFIPLKDTHGKLINGLSNVEGEERLFEEGETGKPLPLDQNGVDPEAIRILPDGKFLISEENSPSILVVSPKGQVLMRYTPASKPLARTSYPTKAILPAVFAQRRPNKGFENLALSSDGRFAFAILQSPMGDEEKKRFGDSRVMRAVKLDVSQPLDAKVVGEYLLLASPAREYSSAQKQHSVTWSDADWIAPDKLLVVEHAKDEARLLLVDLNGATNLLGRKDESTLVFEDTQNDLGTLGVRAAQAHQVFSTREIHEIDTNKIEGIAVLNATDIALANDNDFGGNSKTGELSKIWVVRLAKPLPMAVRLAW